jgi:predicted phosphodiesterase
MGWRKHNRLMRVAAFSDTHGNLLGLEAVLGDIAQHGPFDHMLVAGDLVNGGPRPAETLERIRALRCPVVVGNTDYYLFADSQALEDAGLKKSERAQAAWAAQQIGPDGVAYLEALPRRFHLDGPDGGILMVHANLDDLELHISPDEDEAALAARLAGVETPVLIFGHLHISYQRRVGNLLLVDVASAGFPRDGDRRAAWAELRHDGDRWDAILHRVPYDVDAAAADLLASGMPRAVKRAKVLREAQYS